jgi:hypothetical protein
MFSGEGGRRLERASPSEERTREARAGSGSDLFARRKVVRPSARSSRATTGMSALPTARGLFRSLLRARSHAFRGDATALAASGGEIRKHFEASDDDDDDDDDERTRTPRDRSAIDRTTDRSIADRSTLLRVSPRRARRASRRPSRALTPPPKP